MIPSLRLFIAFACWIGLSVAPLQPESVEAADDDARPMNFVLIMADDLGYADLSCYGNDRFKTPRLDALAAEGLVFTDFHSSGAVCSPTRAGLLTGRYQQRAGIDGVINADPKANRHHGLQREEVTLAECLKPAGYATACFGKWHLGYQPQYNPTHQGFDVFRGYVSGNIDYQNHLDRVGMPDWWHNTDLVPEVGYSTHLISRHAVKFIEANKDRPFFCYVAHEAPHTPWQGPNDPAFRVEGRTVGERRSPEWQQRAYREMVQAMDQGVGEIVATLDRLDLSRKTMVLFLSDNGATREGNVGPLRGHKGTLWEGGHRVPLIVRAPGTVEPGKTDALAISIDFMPTILDYAGAAPPETRPLDGRSLRDVFSGDEPAERRVFWQHGGQAAVRQGPWKLVRGLPGLVGKVGLFHLGNDLAEQTNLAGEAEHARLVGELSSELASWQADVEFNATKQPEE
jgi:arylsulfatase A-like enzyme